MSDPICDVLPAGDSKAGVSRPRPSWAWVFGFPVRSLAVAGLLLGALAWTCSGGEAGTGAPATAGEGWRMVAAVEGYAPLKAARTHPLCFSPDGKQLAAPGAGNVLRVWNLADGAPATALKGAKGEIYWLDWSCDGKMLAGASADGKVRFFDIASRRPELTLESLPGKTLESVSFLPGNEKFLTTTHDGAQLWLLDSGMNTAAIECEKPITSAGFSPNGNCIVTADEDGAARIWASSGGKCIRVLEGHTKPIVSAQYCSCGRHVLTADAGGEARLWNLQDESCVKSAAADGKARSVAFTADGAKLAIAANGAIHILDTASQQEAIAFRLPEKGVERIAFSPDGAMLISAADGSNSVRLWDAATGKPAGELRCEKPVMQFAVSADGKTVATASEDQSVRIWTSAPAPAKPAQPGASRGTPEAGVWFSLLCGVGLVGSIGWDIRGLRRRSM